MAGLELLQRCPKRPSCKVMKVNLVQQRRCQRSRDYETTTKGNSRNEVKWVQERVDVYFRQQISKNGATKLGGAQMLVSHPIDAGHVDSRFGVWSSLGPIFPCHIPPFLEWGCLLCTAVNLKQVITLNFVGAHKQKTVLCLRKSWDIGLLNSIRIGRLRGLLGTE